MMDHFIIDGDDLLIMANNKIYLCVIGTTDLRKNYNNGDDIGGCITLYRTGTEDGSTGTTVFLLSGKIPRRGFNYNFLIKYGASLGSVIIMTDKDYMKTKAWEDMKKILMEGYINLPIIRDNYQWWFEDITYRFFSHHSSLKTPKIRSDRKCVNVNEEANASHMNQE